MCSPPTRNRTHHTRPLRKTVAMMVASHESRIRQPNGVGLHTLYALLGMEFSIRPLYAMFDLCSNYLRRAVAFLACALSRALRDSRRSVARRYASMKDKTDQSTPEQTVAERLR